MEIIIVIAAVLIGILILRAIGAWMLRIDEVISELRKINKKLENK